MCALAGVGLATGGCGPSDREERRLLLERADAIEHSDPGERDRRIAALAALPLASPTLRALRDGCVVLYGATLEAERETAKAESLLTRLEAGDRGGATASPTDIRGAIHASQVALGRAEAARERCVAGLGVLRAGAEPKADVVSSSGPSSVPKLERRKKATENPPAPGLGPGGDPRAPGMGRTGAQPEPGTKLP